MTWHADNELQMPQGTAHTCCFCTQQQNSYRRTCSRPGPGRITPVPLKVPRWTWKTGRRVRPEDCNRVFTTSRGQVTMAPTVPLHLQIDNIEISIMGLGVCLVESNVPLANRCVFVMIVQWLTCLEGCAQFLLHDEPNEPRLRTLFFPLIATHMSSQDQAILSSGNTGLPTHLVMCSVAQTFLLH